MNIGWRKIGHQKAVPRGFEVLLERYPEMDSIFVGNNQIAFGVIQIARQKGLMIPEDIGLVGFDDIPESAYFWPP